MEQSCPYTWTTSGLLCEKQDFIFFKHQSPGIFCYSACPISQLVLKLRLEGRHCRKENEIVRHCLSRWVVGGEEVYTAGWRVGDPGYFVATYSAITWKTDQAPEEPAVPVKITVEHSQQWMRLAVP